MATNKTTTTNVSVNDFIIAYVDKEEKKQDRFRLVELMQGWSGIIRFGNYH